MILIDQEKTIIAGEIGELIIDLAVVVDRYFGEAAIKNIGIAYDDALEAFAELVAIAQHIRQTNNGKSTPKIVSKDKRTKKVLDKMGLPHANRFEDADDTDDSSDISMEDLLKKAAKKLAISKEKEVKSEDAKKEKKAKKSKKSKKSEKEKKAKKAKKDTK